MSSPAVVRLLLLGQRIFLRFLQRPTGRPDPQCIGLFSAILLPACLARLRSGTESMTDEADDIMAARARMIAKRFGGAADGARTGGMRRKKKAVHKTATSDDKKLVTTLKRLGVTNIPAIEEVNMFKDTGEVIHFVNPKAVQASVGANTYVISGNAEIKKLQDLLPGIISELGAENLASLKEIAGGFGGPGGTGAGMGGDMPAGIDDDDDDVPDLVENFEDAAAK
ncbi:unnamed protein product [Phaeothamnion confervicola]